MNAKYYPKLKHHAQLTQSLITAQPDILNLNKAAKQPSDLIVTIHNALAASFGIESKDDAHEVAIMLFYGTYIEVCSHYNKTKIVGGK